MTITIEALKAYIDSVYPERQGQPAHKWIIPYTYTFSIPAPLAAGAAAVGTINMQANSDFFMTRISARASIAAAAQTVSTVPVPLVRLLITDTGSNQQFSNQAVDLGNLMTAGAQIQGTADLPWPRFVGGRSSLLLNLTSYEAAAAYSTLDIALHGVLVFLAG